MLNYLVHIVYGILIQDNNGKFIKINSNTLFSFFFDKNELPGFLKTKTHPGCRGTGFNPTSLEPFLKFLETHR